MKINALSSVLLNVSDLERSRRFYGDLLGLAELGGPDDHVLVFAAGLTPIVLHAHADFGGAKLPGPEDPGAVLLFLGTDDVDAAVEELRSAGVTIAAEPADQPWGERTATVLDPDGHSIFLSQPASPT
jgi:lactoylglutathione lyase